MRRARGPAAIAIRVARDVSGPRVRYEAAPLPAPGTAMSEAARRGDSRTRKLVTRAIGRAAAVFHDIDRHGGTVPDGPVLVVANHPNSLLDPLVIFRTAGRPTRPLAKAPLFEQVFVGSMLRLLGGLPVFRRQDDATLMHRNDQTFDAAIDALRSGHAVQIYPEGVSHSEPALVPLRTGAARIALGAEAGTGWTLGLRIVPIGLTYRRKNLFRGTALAFIGQPFAVDAYRSLHETDPQAAVRALTDEIAQRLQTVTLNLAEHEDLELIETADRLYAREKGLSRWREREDLSEQLPRLQTFARGLAWLHAHDPVRHTRLERAVRRYQRGLALFGAGEADVPPRYETASVLRYVIREATMLILLLPFAAAGAVLWLPAYHAPRLVLRFVKPQFEAVATYKIATGCFVVPVTWLVIAGIIWRLAGPGLGVLALIALPLLGLAAIAWWERWRRVREDARVFVRALTHRGSVDRMASLRAQLAAEFDRILEEAPAIRAPAEPS
ncbi:MAG: 1-acyl-sn-glycerol-3-phosphate acyltransferase [Gemmatimonadetes bacterium]|nr:1-acyl-sn-glycerol-3-phosphate acyltransferase [Gemmatimonadota bacterium]